MPTYRIFAGVNGAGKTSIYKSIYYNEKLREIIYLKYGDIIWKDKQIPNWVNYILQK